MSWLKDEEGDTLLNLEHASKLSVVEVAGKEGEPETLFGLAVWMADEEEPDVTFVGSKEECVKKLEAIAGKLPLIKGV